ncbi:MAG: HAD-IA family hydrolase [Planctomycetota bacterium]|jgi:putative hydrolase of the HAD superfamily|nr:HAD-IA family hydrolase [Planctomycetota bacterium]
MSAPRAVSFDVHGTLILPTPSIGALYAAAAAEQGLSVPADEVEAAFGPAFKAVRSTWDVPYGRNEADARRFWHQVINRTFTGQASPALCDALFDSLGHGQAWRVLPGAHQALALVRAAGLPVYACTNFDGRVHQILADLDLHLDVVFTSAHYGAAKPDPAILLAACAAAACEPSELLHVGDHPHEDAGACSACGARFFAVERGAGINPARLQAALAQSN